MSGAIRKNAREEIRITLDDFKGLQLVNLRVWFDPGNGEYRPGKQGVAFRLDLLPEVLEVLGALEGGAA